MRPGILIGTSARAAEQVGKAVLSILSSKAEEPTKRAALAAFTKSVAVTNTTVQNCTFRGGK